MENRPDAPHARRLNTGRSNASSPVQADITVCTHFLPAEIISYLINKGKLDARLSIVVTDLDVHAMWLCRTFHRYFVALEESRFISRTRTAGDNITVSGIPIDPAFGLIKNRDDLRLQAGFDTERPLFLISGGALGVSRAGVLDGLARLRHPAQAVVICGRNTEMQSEMEQQAAPSKRLIRA